jgi:uncharacterized protein (TIGR03437 family)
MLFNVGSLPGADKAARAAEQRLASANRPKRTAISLPNDRLLEAASFKGLPAPGALASWFGDFGVPLTQATSIPLPTTLGGLKLVMGTRDQMTRLNRSGGAQPAGGPIEVPLLFVSPGQINFQVPWELTGLSNIQGAVLARGEVGGPVDIQLPAFSPSVFPFGSTGVGPAVAFNGTTGTVAQPNGTAPGFQHAGIRPGEVLTVFVGGLGRVIPTVATGNNSVIDRTTVLRTTVETVRLRIGGVEQLVQFAGLTPEFVGVYQVNAIIAPNTPSGIQDMVVTVGGALSQERVTILVDSPNVSGLPLKDNLVAPLPAISLNPPQPAGSSTATLLVSDPSAQSIRATALGSGCGAFGVHTASGNTLSVSRAVGAFGLCSIVAELTTGQGAVRLETVFTVEPVILDLPGVQVTGGLFVPGSLPAASGNTAAVAIASIDKPGALINSGAAQLRIRPSSVTALNSVSKIRVAVQGAAGASGFYEVLPSVDQGTLTLEVARLEKAGSGLTGAIALLVQLVDRLGNIGQAFTATFNRQDVGTANVKVSLSWDTPTDVDLHLVEPGGEEIFYDHDRSAAGGVLDLDSNAGCSIDGVNNENITYLAGRTPPVGEYILRVDFWEDCGGTGANTIVTTTVCGDTRTFPLRFPANSDDRGGRGDGIEVTRFRYAGCRYQVSGKAMYEDRAQTTSGLSSSTTRLPIRFSKVEVRRTSDNVTLAKGSTDQRGQFTIDFENAGPAGYYVLVLASQDNAVVKQDVLNAAGKIYSVQSAPLNEVSQPQLTDLEVIAVSTDAGPAFNIFDTGVTGAAFIRGAHAQTPAAFKWQWDRGQRGACTANVSCFFSSSNLISVLSIPADPDEYDDLVLLHELGHFWQYNFSRSQSPGGSHSGSSQVDPRLAWGEGSATFFGNLAKGTSLYLDTTAAGLGVRVDIESLATSVPTGTSNALQSGNVSEDIVGAVLWDLADATNETNDTLNAQSSVFAAASLLRTRNADRGFTGVDLVDFLDAWFCSGNTATGTATTGVRGNVVGLHKFNYDFAANCN